jgi:hypothetical protein
MAESTNFLGGMGILGGTNHIHLDSSWRGLKSDALYGAVLGPRALSDRWVRRL